MTGTSTARAPLGSPLLAAAALAVAVAALFSYRATMLPGFDFGDTAAFQDKGGEAEITPRQGYPLYFALGGLMVHAVGGEPAVGMNLTSVVCGAVACGLVTWLGCWLAGSLAGGVLAGLLFGASYTFWSQAIIAEVYALHVVMLAASMLALLWWGRAPSSSARLGAFFGVYALGFGNHLMMILFAPAAIVYLASRMPGGVRGLFRPQVVLLAASLAALGSLQYLWNLRYLYSLPQPPATTVDALQTLWFDVTKTDWRASMVAAIDQSAYRPRLAMYWFDLTQQFGTTAIVVALAGFLSLAARRSREALLLGLAWLVAVAFAYTYNVGDAHVFFLPSHLCVALAAGCGLASLEAHAGRRRRAAVLTPVVAALIAVAWPAWRAYDTWPAVDRSDDRRPLELIRQLTRDLDPRRRLLVADLNWQLQNGLDYYTEHVQPAIAEVRGGDRVLTLPWLIHDNVAAGREVVVVPATKRLLETAYGGVVPLEQERAAERPRPLDVRVATVPAGTPYVLALLQPYRDLPYDRDELARTVRVLTGGTATIDPDGVYTIMAGTVGRVPEVVRADGRPFRLGTTLAGIELDLRMESWLPSDTMRRAGFGHVIANRRHALILERGVNFVALAPDGSPRLSAYASGLFAPLPRFVIRPAPAGPKG